MVEHRLAKARAASSNLVSRFSYHLNMMGCRQAVKAQDFDSCTRWFKSTQPRIQIITFIGLSPSGKAMDSDSIMRRFKSCHPDTHLDCVMVGIAQLVRAPDCGSGGRGFESHYPP